MKIKCNICPLFFFFFSFLGRPDHAGSAADPRTDRYVAPRAATEHPHPQRADSEDCRSTLTVKTEVSSRLKLYSDSEAVLCCREIIQ